MPPKKKKPRIERSRLDAEGRSKTSGAAKRRKAKEREEAAEEQDAGGDDGAWLNDFKAAGKPDLDNPDLDLDFMRKLQLIGAYQAVTTLRPTPRQRECWRTVKDMASVVGMTSNRTKIESRIKRIEKSLEEHSAAPNNIVRVEPAGKRPKPPTARGQRPPGPRALPPEETAPEEPNRE